MLKKKSLTLVTIFIILYWLPFVFISIRSAPFEEVSKLPKSDAVTVFGTLVRNSQVSALLKERLDASIAIIEAGKAKKVVVSNTAHAANVMKGYLLNNGIQPNQIEVDPTADKTPDTCRYEKKANPNQRSLIFVSQGYHLARISYQCNKLDVSGATFPAENLQKNRASLFSSWEVFGIRVTRYAREAGLTWLVLLGVYR